MTRSSAGGPFAAGCYLSHERKRTYVIIFNLIPVEHWFSSVQWYWYLTLLRIFCNRDMAMARVRADGFPRNAFPFDYSINETPPLVGYTGLEHMAVRAFRHHDEYIAFDPLTTNRRFQPSTQLAGLGTLVISRMSKDSIQVLIPDCTGGWWRHSGLTPRCGTFHGRSLRHGSRNAPHRPSGGLVPEFTDSGTRWTPSIPNGGTSIIPGVRYVPAWSSWICRITSGCPYDILMLLEMSGAFLPIVVFRQSLTGRTT